MPPRRLRQEAEIRAVGRYGDRSSLLALTICARKVSMVDWHKTSVEGDNASKSTVSAANRGDQILCPMDRGSGVLTRGHRE